MKVHQVVVFCAANFYSSVQSFCLSNYVLFSVQFSSTFALYLSLYIFTFDYIAKSATKAGAAV